MPTNDPTQQLREAIRELELKRDQELYLLKEQMHATYYSLTPVSMVKGALKGIVHNQEVKKGALDIVLSMATGYLTNKLLVGRSLNPVKHILGAVVQNQVTRTVSKNADNIEWSILNFLSGLTKKRKGKEKVAG
jgi:hypothetical protein